MPRRQRSGSGITSTSSIHSNSTHVDGKSAGTSISSRSSAAFSKVGQTLKQSAIRLVAPRSLSLLPGVESGPVGFSRHGGMDRGETNSSFDTFGPNLTPLHEDVPFLDTWTTDTPAITENGNSIDEGRTKPSGHSSGCCLGDIVLIRTPGRFYGAARAIAGGQSYDHAVVVLDHLHGLHVSPPRARLISLDTILTSALTPLVLRPTLSSTALGAFLEQLLSTLDKPYATQQLFAIVGRLAVKSVSGYDLPSWLTGKNEAALGNERESKSNCEMKQHVICTDTIFDALKSSCVEWRLRLTAAAPALDQSRYGTASIEDLLRVQRQFPGVLRRVYTSVKHTEAVWADSRGIPSVLLHSESAGQSSVGLKDTKLSAVRDAQVLIGRMGIMNTMKQINYGPFMLLLQSLNQGFNGSYSMPSMAAASLAIQQVCANLNALWLEHGAAITTLVQRFAPPRSNARIALAAVGVLMSVRQLRAVLWALYRGVQVFFLHKAMSKIFNSKL